VIAGVGHQVEFDIVLPGRIARLVAKSIGAVADRMLPERRHVFQRSGGQRVEGRKPKPQCEVDRRTLEPNGELMVIDHLKPGHPGRRWGRCGRLVETGDWAEKALLQLSIGRQRTVIPGVDERVRGNR
jgi:hypothetical protein